MTTGDLNSKGLQFLEETGANASCSEGSMSAVFIGMLFDEPIDILHLDNVTFHPGNFADAHYASLAIGKSLQLHDDSQG